MGLQIKYNKLISTTNFRQKNNRAVQIFQQIRNTFHFAGGGVFGEICSNSIVFKFILSMRFEVLSSKILCLCIAQIFS